MADASWEDLLADPLWQTPFDTELLPHLLAFGPPVAIEVRRCRCAAVHVGRCDGSQTFALVDDVPADRAASPSAPSAATDAGRAADAPGPYPSSALPSDGA